MSSNEEVYQLMANKKSFYEGLFIRISYIPNRNNEHVVLKLEAGQ